MKNPLHDALLDLVGVFNRPQPDHMLLQRANVSLDRALFPLLVRIGMRGPIGVVELADLAGRDHSTVSRQVAKLEELGLVTRSPSELDQRVKEAVVTEAGRRMVDQIGAARNRLFDEVLADWDAKDRAELTRLVRKLADAALSFNAK
ncbi:MarR family winged helix-turn-helix transcriptional regulator [Collimonas sp. NPDC087041]|uniref:MarR family winged helix-turn-helix transcriptional regulator n=1 Tax=Collimonas sp. NPDC087041 TaxID=3363960 RepID=UPI00381BE88E